MGSHREAMSLLCIDLAAHRETSVSGPSSSTYRTTPLGLRETPNPVGPFCGAGVKGGFRVPIVVPARLQPGPFLISLLIHQAGWIFCGEAYLGLSSESNLAGAGAGLPSTSLTLAAGGLSTCLASSLHWPAVLLSQGTRGSHFHLVPWFLGWKAGTFCCS